MDTDPELFMECEEEELEPWQQIDSDVEEDDDYDDNSGGEERMDICERPWSKQEKPPDPPRPAVTTASTLSTPQVPARAITTITSTTSITTTGTANNPTTPNNVAAFAPPPTTAAIPQGQQLFLTQTPAGTFLVPAGSPQAPAGTFLVPAGPTQTGAGTFLVPAGPGGPGRQILLTSPNIQGTGRPLQMTRLVLNVTPGSNLQPLTFFQSPPLAPVVQPRPPPPVGTVRPTYVTLPVSQPAPSVAKPSSAPIIVTAKAPPPSPTQSAAPGPKVVMTVEEFYYGQVEGQPKDNDNPVHDCYQCQICRNKLMNNIGLMQHMLCHCDVIMFPKTSASSRDDDMGTTCRDCYRLFSSPQQLRNHYNLVHTPNPYPSICKICDWAFDDETIFLNHMKTNHKPGEMPYACQVCSYRSSFYNDVVNHFKEKHSGHFHLLCIFCLKVFKTGQCYQGHFLRHKKGQGFHCSKCRLQFVMLKDKMDHKHQDHKSFQRPERLKGLPAGAKVTIRLSHPTPVPVAVTPRTPITHPVAVTGLAAPPLYPKAVTRPTPLNIKPISIDTEEQQNTITAVKTSKTGYNRTQTVSTLRCMECGTNASDLFAHFPTYVRCLLCTFSTCCSQAYASHMIHKHVPLSSRRRRRPPPCPYHLRCSSCDFVPRTGDQMAKHLVFNPSHTSMCSTTPFVKPSVYASAKARQPGPMQNAICGAYTAPEAAWRQPHNWTNPIRDSFAAAEFTQRSGPHHTLTQKADAMDYFNLLFPTSLVELIAHETNAHASAHQDLHWEPVTTDDIRSFLGLVILMGTKTLPDISQYWDWSIHDNGYTFYHAMSFKRFQQISANIRMGNEDQEEDPLCMFRAMLELQATAMWTVYRPRCCLTIDHALLPQSKRGPPGTSDPRSQPEIWLLCDSKSGYCHRVSIQGRVAAEEESSLETGFRVVPALMEGLGDKYHQLYLANSLASVPLMAMLLDQAIYASSSFPPPSPILPAALWDSGRLYLPGDFVQRRCGPLLATRWRDTKEMGCLCTNASPGAPDTVWRRSQTKAGELAPMQRPMAFRLLQENMRGVDICKQLLACNPLGGIPDDRYWRRLFWFLVNLSIVNAFILLRESRKDNPPNWVHNGLFSQSNFRKRLGNQLAKCAQKALEELDSPQDSPFADHRLTKVEPLKQRHRIVKVSIGGRRCRMCTRKNLRRESVYGCSVCLANLCKDGSCFWDFHGLPTPIQGSTKIGFLHDASSKVGFSSDQLFSTKEEPDDGTLIDEMDEAMAPIEEISSGDEEMQPGDLPGFPTLEDAAEEFRVADYEDPPLLGEDSLTSRQLRICLLAMCVGLQQASRDFNTQPQVIMAWLKERRKKLKKESRESSLSEGEVDMLEWVLVVLEQQAFVTESLLFQKAQVLRRKGSFGSGFRISYDWALVFMLRHGLGPQRPGRKPSLSRVLPPSMQERVQSFRDFTQRQIQASRLPPAGVAAMDELCVFVDLNYLHGSCTAAQRVEALKLRGSGSGSGCPLLTVYLTVLSDGTVLPGLVLLKSSGLLPALEECLLVETRPTAFSHEDGMELWRGKVWHRHLSSLSRPRKHLLVLDSHREHLSQASLCALSAMATLPAVVPAGCSQSLQPLDICLRPVLQRYLLHRWACAMATPLQDAWTAKDLELSVCHLLLDFLQEALRCLASHTHLLKRSFQLAGILPGGGEGQEEKQSPEEVQAHLLRSLWEALVGTEAADREESTDELEEMLEDEGGEEVEEEKECAKEGAEEVRVERKEPEEERREEAGTRTDKVLTTEDAKTKTVKTGKYGGETEEIKTGVDGERMTVRCLTEDHREMSPTCP